jgi:hypothetical protein
MTVFGRPRPARILAPGDIRDGVAPERRTRSREDEAPAPSLDESGADGGGREPRDQLGRVGDRAVDGQGHHDQRGHQRDAGAALAVDVAVGPAAESAGRRLTGEYREPVGQRRDRYQPADAVAAPARLISRPLGALTVSRAITTELPAVAESARRTSPVCTGRRRNDPIIAPIACAHRTHMTGWSNVARAASSEVLPMF